MSEKNNTPADNSRHEKEFEGQGVDDARHKRDLRNDAVNKSSPTGNKSGSDKSESPDERPPGAIPKEGESGAAPGQAPGQEAGGAGKGAGGNWFDRNADKLEQASETLGKAGNAAKKAGGAAKAAGRVAGKAAQGAAKGASCAIAGANALNAAANDPAEAVKQGGKALGGAILKKVMALVAPLVFKIILFTFCILIILMPFVLIFGLSESEPSPADIARAEADRERGDRFDVVDWNDNEETFDWLVAEMTKAREQLVNVISNDVPGFANDILGTYAAKWGVDDAEGTDYSYRLRFNQSVGAMQMDIAAIIVSMYSASRSSGGENDSYGTGDGDGFIDSVDGGDADDYEYFMDIKGDFKSLLRQAQKLAIRTYKVELVYPTGERTLIYPSNLNMQIGWSNGPYLSVDWTDAIKWSPERDNFYANGSFVREIDVPIYEDGEDTGETEPKTVLADNCVIAVNIDIRDEFFDEMVKYFDMEIPEGMDPAAAYRAKRDVYTREPGWQGYLDDAADREVNLDPDNLPTNFETALDAAFNLLHTKGVTLGAGSGGGGGGGESMTNGDVKYEIEKHANETSSTLIWPGKVVKPVPSYWSQHWHLFNEPRNGYYHQGTDTGAKGEIVTAGADGEIVKVVNKFAPGEQYFGAGSDARGNLVIIYYGEDKSTGIRVYMVYQHTDAVYVSTGDKVSVGDQLSIVGATGECYGANGGDGAHLHTETHFVHNSGGMWIDAMAQDSDLYILP